MTPPASAPRIAAIVCTHRRHAMLADCLNSLQSQTIPAEHREIIVVDNSADHAATGAFAWPAEIRLIIAPRPGLARARNTAIRAARAPVLAFIDDDAIAAPGWLAGLLEGFDEGAGVVGGPVIPVWPTARPAWLDPWHDGFLSIVDRGPVPRTLAPDEWLAGTNVAFAAAALAILDDDEPFPEHLGRVPGALLGNEELAVCAQLRERGVAARWQPSASVRHAVHPTRLTQGWMRRRITWQAISDVLLDGDRDGADTLALWDRVVDYLSVQPPAYRGIIGLLRDVEDHAAARAQGEAISALIRLFTSHGGGIECAALGAAAHPPVAPKIDA